MSKRAASGPVDVEDTTTPLAKKPRMSSPELSIEQILKLSESTLKSSKKETLVGHVLALQAAWSTFQTQNVNVAGSSSQAASSSQPTVAPGLDDAKVKQLATKASEMMYSGIKKQMKWQPSCKTGGKQWSYEGVVASPAVFYRLFHLQEEKKEWKQKKIPKEDFFRACGGRISASIRYGSLEIISDTITLKWDKDDNSFVVSGKYGVPR